MGFVHLCPPYTTEFAGVLGLLKSHPQSLKLNSCSTLAVYDKAKIFA